MLRMFCYFQVVTGWKTKLDSQTTLFLINKNENIKWILPGQLPTLQFWKVLAYISNHVQTWNGWPIFRNFNPFSIPSFRRQEINSLLTNSSERNIIFSADVHPADRHNWIYRNCLKLVWRIIKRCKKTLSILSNHISLFSK